MEGGCDDVPRDQGAEKADAKKAACQTHPRRRRLHRSRRERQPDRPEARSQPRRGRHLRLQLPRPERRQGAGHRHRRRRRRPSRPSPTAHTRCRARCSSTSRRRMSASFPGIKEFVAEFTSDAAMGEEGYLADKGLIPLPAGERAPGDAGRAMALHADDQLRSLPARGRGNAGRHAAFFEYRRPVVNLTVIFAVLLDPRRRRLLSVGRQRAVACGRRPAPSRAAFAAGLSRLLCRAVVPAPGACCCSCCGCWPSRTSCGRSSSAPCRRNSANLPDNQLGLVLNDIQQHRRRQRGPRDADPAMLAAADHLLALRALSRIALAVAVGAAAIAGSCSRPPRIVPALRARNSVERVGGHPADRLLDDRDPHHRRHRPFAAVRVAALLRQVPLHRIPVRPAVEPADGDARRPGRQFRRLRRGAAVRRHAADHA